MSLSLAGWLEEKWRVLRRDRRFHIPLHLAASFYRGLWWLKFASYQLGLRSQRLTEKPVISIGNLTLGGTGKTPLVLAVADFLQQRQLSFTLLNRNYGASRSPRLWVARGKEVENPPHTGKFNDEIRLFARHFPEAGIIASTDRGRAATIEPRFFDHAVLLLDDGYSTYNLKKDVNILCFGGSEDPQEVAMMPLGRGREPVWRLRDATVVILQKCNFSNQQILDRWQRFFSRRLPQGRPLFFGEFIPRRAISLTAQQTMDFSEISGKKVLFFGGLGNPTSLVRFLTTQLPQLESLVVPDHSVPTAEQRDKIESHLAEGGMVLTTEKDWVKLPPRLQSAVMVLQSELRIPGFFEWFEGELTRFSKIKKGR